MTIVRNRAGNLVRREVLRDTDPVPESARSRSPTPERDLETPELQLSQALSELTEVQRQIVLLHDLAWWKHREIADQLDLPSGTVSSHLHFVHRALREALGASRAPDRNEALG